MTYVPGWLTEWCEAQSLNADRPDRWPEVAKVAFLAEKLRRFRLHWRWLSKLDHPAIIRQQSGRDELIRQVRRELADAMEPCPDDGPFEAFWAPLSGRSHTERPSVPPWKEIPIEEVLAWVEAKPERIGIRETTARCLCWLEREFSGKAVA